MSPFTPAGERARWREIYALLAGADTGDVVTYEAMAAALGLDAAADRHKIQVAMRRAAREFLVIDLRSVESVPNTGYRVTETERKLELAKRQQSRGARAVRRGKDQVTYADTAALDEPTRALFEAMAWKFAAQDEAIRRLDVRAQRHERQLQAAASGLQQTEAQLARLQERLEKLEAGRQD